MDGLNFELTKSRDSGPGEDGPTKQTDGSNDSTHNCTVSKPGCLLGANSRGVGNAACDHAAADHGGDAHSHGDEAAPVHLEGPTVKWTLNLLENK